MTMLDVVIVGAGAAGLSAALTAHNQGLSYVVLEQRKLANTIVNMPKRKRVFDTPVQLPQRGQLWLSDTTREELPEKWSELSQQYTLNVREQESVAELQAGDKGFQVKSDKDTYYAKRIILGIGTQETSADIAALVNQIPFFANLTPAELPNCIRSCPIGAAKRINPRAFFKLIS